MLNISQKTKQTIKTFPIAGIAPSNALTTTLVKESLHFSKKNNSFQDLVITLIPSNLDKALSGRSERKVRITLNIGMLS